MASPPGKMQITFLVAPTDEIKNEFLDYASWVLSTTPTNTDNNAEKNADNNVEKKRTRLTGQTLWYMMSIFRCTPFPTTEERHVIASRTCLSYKQVTIWFQNTRRRERRRGSKILNHDRQFIDQTHLVK
jgi:Homeodomain